MRTRKAGWSILCIALLAVAAVLLSSGAPIVTASSPGECSVATLKGTYGFLESGTFVRTPPGLPPAPFPYANTGIVTLNGMGSFSGTYTANFGGVAIIGQPVSGTYSVGPNCSYSDQFTPTPFSVVLHHSGVITGQGTSQEVHWIYTDASLVASGVSKHTPQGMGMPSENEN